MNSPNKSKRVLAITLFSVLYAFLVLATLLKYIFLLEGSFDTQRALSFLSAAVMLLLLVFIYALYCVLTRSRLINCTKEIAVICTCMAVTYSLCIFCEGVSIYLMPVSLSAFLLSPLLRRKDTFMSNLFCILMIFASLMAQYNGQAVAAIPLMSMLVVGLFAGSLVSFVLSYERKRLDFLVKGVAICMGAIVLVFVLSYPGAEFSVGNSSVIAELFDDGKWAIISIFAQLLLSLILQPVLEKVFNLLTNSRLIELTDHHNPLIKRLLDEAPGTFNHCLTVANFAEVCATAIGENPYMARTCAYYHDIGKLSKPMFFKENQHGDNPHDKILPEVSVEIIRNHTIEGYKLCRQNHIPEEIARVTEEHHGTLPIAMFFSKAQDLTDGEVDVKKYSYTGSLPTTKIAVIIMICDAAEAALRALETSDLSQAKALLQKLIFSRIQSGQFDECDITLKELNIIIETISEAYGGVYHKRMMYPENTAPAQKPPSAT